MKMQLTGATQDSDPSLADEARELQRAQAGDKVAFHRLVLAHQVRVFTIAQRLTGQRADAEELAQDAFVQLHATLARISSPAHLRHWLIRTVTHRAIDRLRRSARQVPAVPMEAFTGSTHDQAPESDADPWAAARVQGLLMQLQPDARAVVLLRYQEGLEQSEIAKLLDMPVNTVKSHLRRSIEWLRAQFEGEHHGI
jgi:RNA polymerase sigma-70 factor, ECF subfamily